jgi:predicted amidophosphoribosyltransferase
MKANNAVSTGLGLGIGFALTNYMFQTMKPYSKTAKPLVICLKCQGKNALENRFCWNCGSAIYPQSRIQCTKCKATVPSMKYCGNCGYRLKK